MAAREKGKFFVPNLVVANAVGAGRVQGVKSQITSNMHGNELFSGESFTLLGEAIPSALESTAYAVTHPRRWWREKKVIQQANI